MSRIALVIKCERFENGSAEIQVEKLVGPNEYVDLMEPRVELPQWALLAAAEYLTHIVAQSSGLGYEGALEKIAQGAMTYRNKEGG